MQAVPATLGGGHWGDGTHFPEVLWAAVSTSGFSTVPSWPQYLLSELGKEVCQTCLVLVWAQSLVPTCLLLDQTHPLCVVLVWSPQGQGHDLHLPLI